MSDPIKSDKQCIFNQSAPTGYSKPMFSSLLHLYTGKPHVCVRFLFSFVSNCKVNNSETRNDSYLATKSAIPVQPPAPVSSPRSCSTSTFSRRLVCYFRDRS